MPDDAGRKAIFRAVASKQGITDEDEVESMLNGASGRKLSQPAHIRQAMQEIGLGATLAPINMFDILVKPGDVLMAEDAWQDLSFEVALDSGSVVHVCSPADCQG